MPRPAAVKAALQRVEAALAERPEAGRATRTSRTVVEGGFTAVSTEDGHRFAAGILPQLGGDGAAPTPGVLARAALGSCCAISYALGFARAGIPLARLEVTVEADLDYRSMFAAPDAPRGFHDVRLIVEVDSPADPTAILRTLDEAEAGSFVLATFTQPTAVARTVRINGQTPRD